MNLTPYDEGWIKGFKEGFVESYVESYVESFEASFKESFLIGYLTDALLFAVDLKFGRVDEAVAAHINALSTLEEIQRAQTLLKRAKTSKGFLRELAGG